MWRLDAAGFTLLQQLWPSLKVKPKARPRPFPRGSTLTMLSVDVVLFIAPCANPGGRATLRALALRVPTQKPTHHTCTQHAQQASRMTTHARPPITPIVRGAEASGRQAAYHDVERVCYLTWCPCAAAVTHGTRMCRTLPAGMPFIRCSSTRW